jgi:hypothetical protein
MRLPRLFRPTARPIAGARPAGGSAIPPKSALSRALDAMFELIEEKSALQIQAAGLREERDEARAALKEFWSRLMLNSNIRAPSWAELRQEFETRFPWAADQPEIGPAPYPVRDEG